MASDKGREPQPEGQPGVQPRPEIAGRVLAYFRRRVGDAELAADLTAETFAAALEGRRRFAPERGPAAGWLSTSSSPTATRGRTS